MLSPKGIRRLRMKSGIELVLHHLVSEIAEVNCDKKRQPGYLTLLKMLKKRVEEEIEKESK